MKIYRLQAKNYLPNETILIKKNANNPFVITFMQASIFNKTARENISAKPEDTYIKAQ